MQYVVICMDDDKRYIQATRRRFLTLKEAKYYMAVLSKSRNPMVVKAKAIGLGEDGYPLNDDKEI